jgi:hypothetical protein
MTLAAVVRAADTSGYMVGNSTALCRNHRLFFEPRKCFAAVLFCFRAR